MTDQLAVTIRRVIMAVGAYLLVAMTISLPTMWISGWITHLVMFLAGAVGFEAAKRVWGWSR